MNKLQRYLVGTLFDEEEQDKKTNLSNMKAKDPMGNTRWKGAFTGGFEAGYKNTCGSKQGWAPASFVSSIYKKAETNQRTIFDYMDKEDLGRENISQNIVLANSFDTSKNEHLSISLQESIGERILNRLKKAEAYRTAPQSKQQLDKLFQIYAHQEKQKQKPAYNLKDLIQPLSVGANLGQIQIDEFIDAYEDFYKKVIREHAKQETEEELKKRREENKIYFDFTKPLEQEPDYLKEIHQIEDMQKPKKRKKNLINQQTLKSIFTPSVAFKEFKEIIEIQKAPQDYDPFARMRGLQAIGQKNETQQHNKHKILTVDKRSELLGQMKLSNKFVTSQNSLANKFISNDQKVKQMKKVFEDQKKNIRFHQFIQEMEGKKISSQLQYLTYQQAEKERAEFQQMFKVHKSNQTKQQTITKAESLYKKQGSTAFYIDRRVESWRPQKLLCKRFNVLTPYNPPKKQATKQQYQYY